MVEMLYSQPAAMLSTTTTFTRADHMSKEHNLRGQNRTPRRSQTHDNYGIPSPLAAARSYAQHIRVIEPSPPASPQPTPTETAQAPNKELALRPRPTLGPRRRSYSVTDKEPAPVPSSGLELMDLPAELHFVIFDNLDLIDSVCLGLTNKHFYSIHRRLRGTVPLSTRRHGPNELEWAFHLAGVKAPPSTGLYHAETAESDKEKVALSKLRVRGQGYCRKCGITRCSLHKHIQSWMGEEAEYCSVKQKFGRAAPEGAKAYCYMSKPGDPSRCGRHWVRKSKVVLQ
ncbi:hypothetical protein QBC39DRAFT_158161 [Podospora conica]|nr:hypothetical protein QBC39DRAFT_158161 [Schizothecium conicum]